MLVYEFWLKEQLRREALDAIYESFEATGKMSGRWDDPRDETGDPTKAPCVYSISRNQRTSWVQLLVDINTPAAVITAIEGKINGLKDDAPVRKYTSDRDDVAPIETPRPCA